MVSGSAEGAGTGNIKDAGVKQRAGPLEGARLYFLTGEWVQIRLLWDRVRQGFGAFSPETCRTGTYVRQTAWTVFATASIMIME
jgi:hypothetical protein